jgi:diaminopimelate decarboxylase
VDHFQYRGDSLHAEDVSIEAIADKVGTPFYCYSSATITRHFTVFREAFGGLDVSVHYAVKANGNLAVLRTLARLGAGADVVSGGELRLALKAGIAPRDIVFSGVGKTAQDLADAVDLNVGQINVESEPELEMLSRAAAAANRRVRIALRVNPDVDAGTHHKITTGTKENKFGIDWTLAPAIYRRARALPGIDPSAIAVHIGSQITDLRPLEHAFQKVRDLALMLRRDGIGITHLDLGGGLGVPYDQSNDPPPQPADYAAMVRRVVGDLGCHLSFEPGRLIVGNAGIMVSRVVIVKEGIARKFVVVDAGMNDLIRPAMYDARHDIIPVRAPAPGAPRGDVDVVGPVCESTDKFASDVALPALAAGDLVAFRTAGAYGAVMSSTYNMRPLIPEVLVSGHRWSVVRRRPTFDEMMALEALPSWVD